MNMYIFTRLDAFAKFCEFSSILKQKKKNYTHFNRALTNRLYCVFLLPKVEKVATFLYLELLQSRCQAAGTSSAYQRGDSM